MYAVVRSGGKQMKVSVGETVSVEKLDAAPGTTVTLSALLVSDDDKVLTGKDAASADVTAEVLGHGKADKVIVFKFKKRKGYKKTRGHRQDLTLLKVTDIVVGGKSAKAAAPKAEAAAKAEKPAAKKPAAKASPAKADEKAPAAKKPAAKAAPTAKKVPVAAKAAAEKAPAKKAPAAKKPAADKAPAAKKPAAKKPAAKKTEKPAE